MRRGDALDDEQSVVVRGGELNAVAIRADAQRHYAAYGTYGISVLALRDTTFDELAQQPPLIRFEFLTLLSVGVIREAGLRLEPTGRNPRHFTVAFDDLDAGAARVCQCEHVVRANPYHES